MAPKTYPVTVTLDTSTTPPKFTFSADPVVEHGKANISWGRGGTNFVFAAVAFYEGNPFSSIVVQDSGITAVDDNQAPHNYKYCVLVRVPNGTYYSSTLGAIDNGGPTIRNN